MTEDMRFRSASGDVWKPTGIRQPTHTGTVHREVLTTQTVTATTRVWTSLTITQAWCSCGWKGPVHQSAPTFAGGQELVAGFDLFAHQQEDA